MADSIKEENEIHRDSTRIIYEFTDSEKEIKKVSKEVYLKEDIIIHYPWGFDGKDKYKNARFPYIHEPYMASVEN